MPQGKKPLADSRDRPHPPLDRRRRQRRHAARYDAADRCRASARLQRPARHHVARLVAGRRRCWPSPASTKCCCTRPMAAAWSPGWSACPSESSRSASRPMARSSPSPAAGPAQMGEVQIWDVAERTAAALRSGHHDTVYGASWSPDGKRVAFGCTDKSVRVDRCRNRRAGAVIKVRTTTGCSTRCSRSTAAIWCRSAATWRPS